MSEPAPDVYRLKPRAKPVKPEVYLSPFKMGEYLNCGERFRLRYIERIPAPAGPSPAAVRGRSLAKGAEHDFRAVAAVLADGGEREGADLPLEEVTDAAVMAFEKTEQGIDEYERANGEVDVTHGPKPEWELHGESAGKNKDLLAKAIIPRWYEQIAPTVRPKAVEHWGKVTIERDDLSIVLRARLDVLPADGELTDLKHSKLAFGKYRYAKPEDAAHDDQLTFQDLIHREVTGEPPKQLGFDTILLVQDRKSGDVDARGIATPRVPPRTDAELEQFVGRVERVAKGIQAGVFVPATKGKDWQCSEKWCGYWRVCRFGGA